MKKWISLLCITVMLCLSLTGCNSEKKAAIKDFEAAAQLLEEKNEELYEAISEAEKFLSEGTEKYDEASVADLEAAIVAAKEARKMIPKQPKKVDEIIAATKEMMKVDYSDILANLVEKQLAVENSVPKTEETVETLEGELVDLDDMVQDENGQSGNTSTGGNSQSGNTSTGGNSQSGNTSTGGNNQSGGSSTGGNSQSGGSSTGGENKPDNDEPSSGETEPSTPETPTVESIVGDYQRGNEALFFYSDGTVAQIHSHNSEAGYGTWTQNGNTINFTLEWKSFEGRVFQETCTIVDGGIMWGDNFYKKSE